METLMHEIFVGPVIESNYTSGEKRIRATNKTKIVCWGKKISNFKCRPRVLNLNRQNLDSKCGILLRFIYSFCLFVSKKSVFMVLLQSILRLRHSVSQQPLEIK